MIAGIHDRWIENNRPPELANTGFYVKGNYMNGGFIVLSPSQRVFDYYLALLDIPTEFDMAYQEQDLLNFRACSGSHMVPPYAKTPYELRAH